MKDVYHEDVHSFCISSGQYLDHCYMDYGSLYRASYRARNLEILLVNFYNGDIGSTSSISILWNFMLNFFLQVRQSLEQRRPYLDLGILLYSSFQKIPLHSQLIQPTQMFGGQ